MKFVDLKCPQCNATLSEFDGNDIYTCPYCKSVLLAEFDDNTVKLRTAKAEHEFKKFQMEHEAKEREKAFKREQKSSMLLWSIVIINMAVMIIIAICSSISENMKLSVPLSSNELCKLQYEEAYDVLINAGFTEIKETALDNKPIFKKTGQVSSISISGETKFKSGDKFAKDAVVIITYYKD